MIVTTNAIAGGGVPKTPNDSILFYAHAPFTVEIKNRSKNWPGTVEISTDHNSWSEWDGTTVLQAGENRRLYVLYIRGISNTRFSGDSGSATNYGFLTIGSGIKCVGNLETLLDYQNLSGNVSSNAFKYIFSNCQNLDFDLQIPHPVSSLATNCYLGAFSHCGSLTKAPVLDSMTLAPSCYKDMFAYCTSLSQAPRLPATALETECYSGMFSGCTALTTAPELPATTLTSSCYQGMFSYCNSLASLPSLPATDLANNCYEDMFSHSSASALPELPATTLKNYCYRNMFAGCSGVKLSSTQAGDYQIEYRIPSVGTGTTATSALYNFCANTGGTFSGDLIINTTYYTSNTVVPATSST